MKINYGDSLHPIIIADAIKRNLYFINRNLQITDSLNTGGPIVNIDFEKNKLLACNIWILNPNNGKFGKADFITISPEGVPKIDSAITIDSLERPVQITSADFNKDGKQDYLVCEFGNLKGALSWMENLGNNTFKRHIIREVPGAIKEYVGDYNHDGMPDI